MLTNITNIDEVKKQIKNLQQIEDFLYERLTESLNLRPEEENYLFDYIFNENDLTYSEYVVKYGIK